MFYLNEGFTINHKHDEMEDKHTFDAPTIVCHFSHRDACRNKTWETIECNHNAKNDHGVDDTHMFQVKLGHDVREAIARFALLHKDLWAPEGQGKTYIVTDLGLAPLPLALPRREEPSMRGGGVGETFRPIPVPSESYIGLTEDFDGFYDQLVHNTLTACGQNAQMACTETWVSVAGILQMRNRYLERQLEELKELHVSVVEDLKWNMEMLARLEDKLDTAEEEKAHALVELGLLKRSMQKEEETTHGRGKREEVPRLANPTPSRKDPANYRPLKLLPWLGIRLSQLSQYQSPRQVSIGSRPSITTQSAQSSSFPEVLLNSSNSQQEPRFPK
jgi:hypothetical protein